MTTAAPPYEHGYTTEATLFVAFELSEKTWKLGWACLTARAKVRKQLPALAALVDFWWGSVEQDLEHAGLSTCWRAWAREYLLPRVYWAYHVTHTRCARRKAKLREALEASQAAASPPGPGRVAGVGQPARARLSTHLVRR